MVKTREGGCLCDAVRYQIEGENEFTIRCFCKDCQRLSGGGHMPAFIVGKDSMTISGPMKFHKWQSDKGNELELTFCAECSAPIYRTTKGMPQKLFVTAGSLDDPSEFEIQHEVYEPGRQPWDHS